jgi:hypothetical protein
LCASNFLTSWGVIQKIHPSLLKVEVSIKDCQLCYSN